MQDQLQMDFKIGLKWKNKGEKLTKYNWFVGRYFFYKANSVDELKDFLKKIILKINQFIS